MATKTGAERDLEARAALFKALAHPVRLLILNLVREQPRHTEELAAMLRLRPATISHHLSQLLDAGLVRTEREQYYQMYALAGAALDATVRSFVFLRRPDVEDAVALDAYRQKVLDTFLRRGRLVRIPAQRKKRDVILERLARDFEPDRDYDEAEVNRVLVEYHDDVAALRRGLVEAGLMTRAGGRYRLAAPAARS